jgi:hypothetical protein
MKKLILGECADILRVLPSEQLNMFAKMRLDTEIWENMQKFAKEQKDIKMDQIYRLRRPKTQDDVLKNAIEHEYYAARITSLVIILQLMENAQDELERRERKKP